MLAACVVTYRRDPELNRLLAGLATCGPELGAVVVVDDAASERGGFCGATPPPSATYRYLPIESENFGPGAGWKRGMQEALKFFPDNLTHFLLLDDDVALDAQTLHQLLEPAVTEPASHVVAPLLTNANGQVWAFPEPVDPELRRVMRRIRTPEDARRFLGTDPLEFCWCTGACVLVSRQAVESVGFPRTDFWMLGEDLEYSMRLSQRFRSVFLPGAIVPHLPPAPASATTAPLDRNGQMKFLSLLQNLSYLSFHSSASRHLWRYLPGNFRRFFRTEGLTFATVGQAVRCFWNGALLARPRGWGKRHSEGV